jgi:hypothetical protein
MAAVPVLPLNSAVAWRTVGDKRMSLPRYSELCIAQGQLSVLTIMLIDGQWLAVYDCLDRIKMMLCQICMEVVGRHDCTFASHCPLWLVCSSGTYTSCIVWALSSCCAACVGTVAPIHLV